MSYSKDPMLLRSIIMDHYDTPSKRIDVNSEHACLHHYQNKSSTCIDDITAYVNIENDVITEVYFSGLGCAVSTASTDIMCNWLVGKTPAQAMEIIDNYVSMTLGQPYNEELLDELIAFYNINNQSNRIKCSQIGVNAIKTCIQEVLANGQATK
ncbi:Fe-S cluster assembly sulfur transfer protein SufU [Ureaplasma ceti]|uniref:SUF system NifU family Fe-S cluster assembly protein n=1 Tax=Ureaplasma ceti TaxID=3119530 RepID=A0ABP9U9C4_9BACT